MSEATVFDATQCQLGEGPLWHPLRNELFWFDILGRKMLWRRSSGTEAIAFDEMASAAGWVDESRLLIASETSLLLFDLRSGQQSQLLPLEAENPVTRSNDGRADRKGGFWISTMGKKAEPKAGAIYRFYRGEIHRLYSDITIPNSICFSPDGSRAYWTDTPTRQIMLQELDEAGWPKGKPEVFIDLTGDGLSPDGSVVDANGHLWNAQWGAGRVAEYSEKGQFLRALTLPAQHSTCPCFVGADLSGLICTSASEGTQQDGSPKALAQGQTYQFTGQFHGMPEARVLL